jgi:pSer/pThr/pTyr-binding forkhead associated (FHA) protein
MDEYLEIRLDIFEHVGQRAQVMKSLKVGELIDEVLKEFDDVPSESPERFALYLKGTKRPLAKEHTLIQADIQPQDELVFEYLRQDIREMLEPHQYAFLRDEGTGRLYGIEWTPAIIGRPTNEAEHNIMLAANLQVHPKGITISRKHAQITFENGHYYLEALADNNPTTLNNKILPVEKTAEIHHDDVILFGKKVRMTFLLQSAISQKVTPQPDAKKPAPARAERASSQGPAVISQPAAKNETEIGAVPTLRLFIEKATVTAGQHIDLVEYPAVIGRSHPLLSVEKEVSRNHLEVRYEPGQDVFFVVDLNSGNGSSLDGNRMTAGVPYLFKPGMRLELGQKVVLLFQA